MALIGNLDKLSTYNSYREDFTNAYFKVENVHIDTDQNKVRVLVRGYLSEYARHNQGIGIFKRVFFIPFEEFAEVVCSKESLFQTAYTYLKALPEFINSSDSLATYSGPVDITKEIVDEQEKTLEELLDSLKK